MKKHTRSTSIKTKIIVSAFILLTIPLFVLGSLSYIKSKDSLEDLGIFGQNPRYFNAEMNDCF